MDVDDFYFNDLVDLAKILNHKALSLLDAELRQEITFAQFRKEFCTVHINIGRRTGKSKYIIENADEDDIVIIRDLRFKDIFKNCKATIMTANQLKKHEHIIGINCVYIDEPRLVFDIVDSESLYKKLESSLEFVLLGE